MHTLYLNPETWDLTLDNNGDIALAKDPYSKAQDVASAARLFDGELYYDTGKGIPYFNETLGKKQPFALYRHRLIQAVLSVPGVVSADVEIGQMDNRILSGRIKFTDQQQKQYEVAL